MPTKPFTPDATCPRCKRPNASVCWQRKRDDNTPSAPRVWTPVYVACECEDADDSLICESLADKPLESYDAVFVLTVCDSPTRLQGDA